MNSWIKIITGLVLISLIVIAWGTNFAGFGTAALVCIKGSLMWITILIGIIFITAGIFSLKE